MNLTQARERIRFFARNAGDSGTYSDADVDGALLAVGTRFCRVTRCLTVAASVALTADVAEADLSGLADFRPERLLAARVLGQACALDLADWDSLYEESAACPTAGVPLRLAFEDSAGAAAVVWPTPAAASTLRVRYWRPFTTWPPGVDDAAADALELNLPDDYLAELLVDGPPAVLQGKEPEHKYTSEAWRNYLAYEASMKGGGDLAARTFTREMME